MRHHIMLLFLSTVHWNKDNTPSIAKYRGIDGTEPEPVDTHTTNESAVRWLLTRLGEQGETAPQFFVYASESVQKEAATGRPSDLAYFKERIAPLVDDINALVTVENFYEEKNVDAALNQIVAMAEKIREYCDGIRKNDPNAEIVLHADFTGGLRHANLMMLILTRLLQYQELEIGHILYSNYSRDRTVNWVDDVTDVYRLFDLIAGTAEFARFGSADILTRYYEDMAEKTGADNYSDELRQLIQAMKGFADQTKLCHYGDMKNAIEGLNSGLSEFEKHIASVDKKAGEDRSKAETNDALMGVMKDEIKRMYSPLFEKTGNREIDDIKMIRWCVERGYLQQALTFYTERIPELLCCCDIGADGAEENAFVVPTARGAAELKKQFDSNGPVSKEYYLFTTMKNEAFEAEIAPQRSVAKAEFIKVLKKDFFSKMQKPYSKTPEKDRPLPAKEFITAFFDRPECRWSALTDKENTVSILEKICTLWEQPQALKEGKDPFARELISVCYEITKDSADYKNSRDEWDKEYNALQFGMKKFTYLMKCLGNVNANNARQVGVLLDFIGDFTYRYSAQIYGLFEGNFIKTRIPEDELCRIVDTYGKLKAERNNSNHAHDRRSKTTEDSLEKMLLNGINEIERVRKEYKTCAYIETEAKTEEEEPRKKVFVNYTNHPSEKWSREQITAAREYGEIIDEAFPDISPEASEKDIAAMAEKACKKLLKLSPSAVLCQGEFSYVYQIVKRLTRKGIPVLAACSERVVAETTDEKGVTHRASEFKFVQFRRYENI
ncbi:TM1812 family CRISPR-associated protein [Schwartzia succinivorans]|jgi:hypothetical protein|uniref:CRISPR-associated (Cas) DxTHG family protein n=1 Tax=Schwartzia succinivorans DSM 10502 TaxID=1123243 RepID=A0A1M4ZAG2_9FIRM|nr:TM1812 family CRISPR-associated protein [Schwartzia succinivorans]SHF15059.1 CRISPR-associated (Cas) DxTHG family protein [Schwartzia succinivorans DSM 10502]